VNRMRTWLRMMKWKELAKRKVACFNLLSNSNDHSPSRKSGSVPACQEISRFFMGIECSSIPSSLISDRSLSCLNPHTLLPWCIRCFNPLKTKRICFM
jgi:hypothetical protein